MTWRLKSGPITQPESAVPQVHSILFFGDILPGHDAISCRRQLQVLLKCPPETMDSVFSGGRVCLRKGLDEADARRYQARLEAIGLRIVIDPPLTPPAPAAAEPEPATSLRPLPQQTPGFAPPPAPQPAPEPTPRATVPAPAAVELINCPACGEEQPRRTLCRACSIDMPRFAASRAAPPPAKADRPAVTYMLTPDAPSPVLADSGIVGLGFRGRFGRRNFALTGLLTLGGTLVLALLAFTLGIPGMLIGGLGLLLMFIYGTRSTVFRLHDLGLSGWWTLVTWIPYLGGVAALLLLVVPGEKGSNAWGEPARPVSAVGLLGGMALIGGALFLAISIFGTQLPSMPELPGVPGNETGKAAFTERYDASRDRIVMYSLSTCGFCAEKRQQFDRMGVRYVELMIDEDPVAEARLNSRLREAGLDSGAIGTPIIEVNGTLLPNNPGFSEIGLHLSRATKI